MPKKKVPHVSTKTVGFMGEALTAFLLEKRFEGLDLRMTNAGTRP